MNTLTDKEIKTINDEIQKVTDKLNVKLLKDLDKDCNKLKNSFHDISSGTSECEKLIKINKDLQDLEDDTLEIFQEIKAIIGYEEDVPNEQDVK